MDVITTVPSLKYLQWGPLMFPGLNASLEHSFPWETLLRVDIINEHPWEKTSQVVSRCTSAKVMELLE